MSSEHISAKEKIYFDIEQELFAPWSTVESFSSTPEMLSEMGKPALTALYADCLLAIDQMPKVASKPRLGFIGEVESIPELGLI